MAGLKDMMGIRTLGTVMNKVPRGMRDLDNWIEYAREIGPVLGTVENDELLDEAFKRNLPVIAAYPRAASSMSMKKIAKRILKMNIKPTRVGPKFRRTWARLWAEEIAKKRRPVRRRKKSRNTRKKHLRRRRRS
jgi:MinD-like ATPase involved in chromosome partitioning or flagellar assembly